jgi:hypothetical protein
MNRQEYLDTAQKLHTEWNLRYADRIEPAEGASDPHAGPGGDSDFAEHHADVSAPPHYADLLDEKLQALTAQYQSDSNPDRGQ